MSLLGLPEELLTAVIDAVVDAAAEGHLIHELWTLRLVCKCLSANKRVNDVLFEKINLICDAKYFSRIDDASIRSIAPHVRHINFVPPLYCPSTDPHRFHEIIRMMVVCGAGCYRGLHDLHAIWAPKPSASPLGPHSQYLRTDRSLQTTHHTAEQIIAAYATYKTAADTTRALMPNRPSSMATSWVGIIKLLPRCTSFKFGLVEYTELGWDLQPSMPNCITQPYAFRSNYVLCEELAAQAAEEFVSFAARVLKESGARIEHLTFAQAVQFYDQYWEKLVGWRQLDLGQLKGISIELMHISDLGRKASPVLQAVESCLTRFGPALEKIDCGRITQVNWEKMQLPRMDKLQVLVLAGNMDLHLLINWIDACPKLRQLVLCSMASLHNAHEADWSLVADALFRHPNAPKLKLRGNWPEQSRTAMLGPSMGNVVVAPARQA